MSTSKGNSTYHGMNGNSGASGSGPGTGVVQVRHGEFCCCTWCLQGHR